MSVQSRFMALFSSSGVVAGGLIWLLAYNLRSTPDIEFDGPAILALLISMLTGWLLISSAGIIIYSKRHKPVNYKKTFLMIFISGLLAGLIAGYILASIAHSQHPAQLLYD